MLESMTIVLCAFGFAFTVLMFLSDREQPVFGILAMMVWFITAASIIVVDVPYFYVYENITTGAYTVVSGTYAVTPMLSLVWLFMGLGFICLAYSMVTIVAMLRMSIKRKPGE